MRNNDVLSKMNIFAKNNRTPALIFAGVLLCVDQVTKWYFATTEHFLCNAVGPWGLPVWNSVLIAVMFVILIGVGYVVLHSGRHDLYIAGVFVLAGGVSNLSDRLAFGCVRDFLSLSFFPVFNLADVFLTIGTGLFVLRFLLKK